MIFAEAITLVTVVSVVTINKIGLIKMPTIDRQQAITISLRLDEKYKPKTSSENRRSYVIDDGKREIEIHYFH